MIFNVDRALIGAITLVLFRSIGLCSQADPSAAAGNAKLPSTIVFSEKPLEKVAFEAGPDQTLAAETTVVVSQTPRPEIAKVVGRAISRRIVISGLRKIYGIADGYELVLEGLSAGSESFEGGVYAARYSIPLAGINAVPALASTRLEKKPSAGGASSASAEGPISPSGLGIGPLKTPNLESHAMVSDFTSLKSEIIALSPADEKLKHEIESGLYAMESALANLRSQAGVSYETAALDLKKLADSFKSKINGTNSLGPDEKLDFCKQIDRMADYGFGIIVDLIR